MKKYLLLLVLFALVNCGFAQSSEIDGLKKELSNHPQQDTFKVNRLNELAFNLALSPENRADLAQEAISISNKINYPAGKGKALVSLALVKGREGNAVEFSELIKEAHSIAATSKNLELKARISIVEGMVADNLQQKLKFYLKADSIAAESSDYILQSRAKYLLANTYVTAFSDYGKGIDYTFKALHLAEKANDTKSLITCWTGLGNIYAQIGDQKNALFYLNKAETANKTFKDLGIEYLLQNAIGERYRLTGKYPEAIKAYRKGLKVGKILDINPSLNESNLADVYTRMDNLPLAFQYAFSALKGAKEINDVGGEEWIYGILSRAYLKENNVDRAIYYGNLGYSSAENSGGTENLRDNALALSEAYAANKDYKNAYTNRLLFTKYRESIFNDEVRNRTAVEQYTYNIDKKEAQINVLNEQKKGQRNLLFGALGLLLLIFTVAALLFRNNKQKQKANNLLAAQKLEIDEKAKALSGQKDNVELLNSIGRKITSSLSIEKVIGTVYKSVNTLMDASVFGIGIYNPSEKTIDFPHTYENGKPLPFYSNSIDDENRLGAKCFKEGKEIILNNLSENYRDYLQEIKMPDQGLQAVSVIFLPLIAKEKKLGVITVQSFKENSYSEYQLFMLRNIAIYAAIALDNAESYQQLDNTLSTLKETQNQLIQSEKMASLGELTAGIAHEIQNPLNFVNNFSEVSAELIDEMNVEINKGDFAEAQVIANDVKQNLEKINHHGKRADAIVKGMLQHSRSSKGVKELTDLNALCDEYLRLSYHGLRAKDKSFNATIRTDFDDSIGKVNLIPQDFGRVILNLLTNAFYAVDEKAKAGSTDYEPTVSITTKKEKGNIIILVSDNGNGIPQEIKEKIFQPFFTTKPTGKGTGLGLSMSFDIINNGHQGELSVDSVADEGTAFRIRLPV
ncbi:ATP-binding protein [Chryseobacterium sp. MP_3.2]|uniref:ATP-binding protein n=1 Tax=Chryseobacterium sp. MP_3.2 TaxID=3071712 RepID=UPI002E06EFF9|nr:signal transduction histidine kinase [Chryseobacterium sp. MP_3.2]